jgi:hypothetical protein
MWRIYYYPNTGMIKYQINIEMASQLEPMPFIDLSTQQDLKDKKVDLVTKQLVESLETPVSVPSFNTTNRFNSRPFDPSLFQTTKVK